MLNCVAWCIRYSVVVAIGLNLVFVSSALATEASGETAKDALRWPIKMQFVGFLDVPPDGPDVALIQLNLGIYRQSYPFLIVKAESVDRPRSIQEAIIRWAKQRERAFDVIGPRALLARIAEAEPGTPLRIVGFMQARVRKLTVTDVEVLGFEATAK